MNWLAERKKILRIYLVLSLIGAASLSPGIFSVVPLALLGLNVYIWLSRAILLELATIYGAAFILPLLYKPSLGTYLPVLLALPLIAYLDLLLKRRDFPTHAMDTREQRRPTPVGRALLVATGLTSILALLLSDWTLGLASAAWLFYLSAILGLALWGIPAKPVQESKALIRIVAGNQASGEVEIPHRSRLAGQLYLSSPYPWVKIKPSIQRLAGPMRLAYSLTPPLAGPSTPELSGVVVDPWGLSQVAFKLVPFQLHIIPRARYADWLARKYLERARPGMVVSLTPSTHQGGLQAAKTGVDYYGERPYQPGDSLLVIDWKHSAKLGQLIVREFLNPYTSPPLLLVNLAVADAEEADKLAYSLLTAALTLAQEAIPTAFAAYHQSAVVQATQILNPVEIVRRAQELTRSIGLFQPPTRYLMSADISRLRTNLARLKGIQLDSAQKLYQLLSAEYTALKACAETNPALVAVNQGLARGKQLAQLIIISSLNHDAEAISLLIPRLNAQGIKVLFLEVGKPLNKGSLFFTPGTGLQSRDHSA